MTGFKTILMAGVAIAALTACSSDRGPGAIGSTNDIIVRNAGEPKAPPPKPLEAPVVTATDATPTDGVTAAPAPVVEAVAPVADTPAVASEAPATTAAPVVATSELVAAPAVTAPAAAPTSTALSIDPVTEVAVANPAPAMPEEVVPVVKADAVPMKNIPMTSPEAPASVTSPAAAPAAAPVETNAAPATAQPVEPAVLAAPAAPSVEMTMATLQSGDKVKVMAVQEELKKAGLYAGKTDGKINTETLNAMIRYQSSQGTLAKAPASAAAQPTPLPPAGQTKPVATTAVAPAPAPAPVAAPVSAPTTPAITAQTPMTDPALIRAVQEKLKAQGLLSSVSGAMDSATLNALVKYQTSNGLAPGVLNLDTVKKLGIVQ